MDQFNDKAFTKELCAMLKEGNRGLMSKVFTFLGREITLRVYDDVQIIQASKGMLNTEEVNTERDLERLKDPYILIGSAEPRKKG